MVGAKHLGLPIFGVANATRTTRWTTVRTATCTFRTAASDPGVTVPSHFDVQLHTATGHAQLHPKPQVTRFLSPELQR